MKAAVVYKPLRESLKPWLKSSEFGRLKSSPPAYSMSYGDSVLCVWFKVSSAGWDSSLGGKFTGAVQLAAVPAPGIDWRSGDFASKRLWPLLTEENRESALDIHNFVIRKLSVPPPGHWIHDCSADVVQSVLTDLRPLTDPPAADCDFWFRFHDEVDVGLWGSFFVDALPTAIERFLSQCNANLK